jgi:hypothetical protein
MMTPVVGFFSIDTGNLTKEEVEKALRKAQKKKKLNEGDGGIVLGPQLLNE